VQKVTTHVICILPTAQKMYITYLLTVYCCTINTVVFHGKFFNYYTCKLVPVTGYA